MSRTALALAVVLFPAATARAESAVLPCSTGVAAPGTASVPANLPSFRVTDPYAYGSFGDEVVLRLEREVGTERVVVDGEVIVERSGVTLSAWFVPSEPLLEGSMYVLTWDVCSAYWSGPTTQRYSVGPPIPYPAPPATLWTRLVALVDGSSLVGYQLEVVLEAGSDLTPWAGSLDLVARANEIVREPAAIEPRMARFSFPVACDGFYGELPEGPTTLHAHAGVPPVLEARSTVDIDCASAIYLDRVTGRGLTPSEIEAVRRAGDSMDAGPRPDAGTFPADAGSAAPPRGGCAVGHGGAAPLAVLAVVLGGLTRRRRARAVYAGSRSAHSA